MTNEQASEILDDYDVNFHGHTAEEVAQAFDCAFKALEQQPCEDATLKDIFCIGCEYKEQQSCEDCISRQAAINAIENEQRKIMRSDWAIDQAKFSAMSEIRALIADLSSVSTEKTGRWKRVSIDKYIQHAMAFYKCSECGGQTIGQTEYCPNCGAKMQEVEE